MKTSGKEKEAKRLKTCLRPLETEALLPSVPWAATATSERGLEHAPFLSIHQPESRNSLFDHAGPTWMSSEANMPATAESSGFFQGSLPPNVPQFSAAINPVMTNMDMSTMMTNQVPSFVNNQDVFGNQGGMGIFSNQQSAGIFVNEPAALMPEMQPCGDQGQLFQQQHQSQIGMFVNQETLYTGQAFNTGGEQFTPGYQQQYMNQIPPHTMAAVFPETKSFPCQFCSKRFTNVMGHIVHKFFCFKQAESLAESQICPVCQQTFFSLATIRQHLIQSHSHLFKEFNTPQNQIQNHQCKSCKKDFNGKGALAAHEVTHQLPGEPKKVARPKPTQPLELVKPPTNMVTPSASDSTKNIQQMLTSTFKKNVEQENKKIQINLLYLKNQKPETSMETHKVEVKKVNEELKHEEFESRKPPVIDLSQTDTSQRRRRFKSPLRKLGSGRRRSRSKSRSRCPMRRYSIVKTSEIRSRRISKSPTRKLSSSGRPRSPVTREPKGRRRSSLAKRSPKRSSDRGSPTIQTKLNCKPPDVAAQIGCYNCDKCATLYTNYRNYVEHIETHADDDEEENYLRDITGPSDFTFPIQRTTGSECLEDRNPPTIDSVGSLRFSPPSRAARIPSPVPAPRFQVNSIGEEGFGAQFFTKAPYSDLRQRAPMVRVKCQMCSQEFSSREYLGRHLCHGPF